MASESEDKAQSEKQTSKTSALRKAVISIGIVGLIGLVADLLGFISFFKSESPSIENQFNIEDLNNLDNSTNYNNQDYSTNNSNNKTINQTINQTFVNKNEYTVHTVEKVIIEGPETDSSNNIISQIQEAIKLYYNDEYDRALEVINQYENPPDIIDPVFFYTFKANIHFFSNNFDTSYKLHLKAYEIDKESKFLDIGKIKGLTSCLGQLKSHGYSLQDLKRIVSFGGEKNIYDLGFEKLEVPNGGYIFVKKNGEDDDFIQLMKELGLIPPGFDLGD